jgi:hypothetical protein
VAQNDLDVNDENSLYEELLQWENRRFVDQRNAGFELAQTVDTLTSLRPYGNPDVIMSMAEGLRDGLFSYEDAVRQIDGAAEVEYKTEAQELDDQAGGTPEWLKTATRWTFAGLELVPQLAENTAMRAFNYGGGPGDESFYTPADTSGGFFDGWFASTDFGAMLSGEDAGNGFFIGEKAYERQQEKVKAYRGMYGGNALTLGRGFSGIFVEPNSQPYNWLSGAVDFTKAVVVPSLPGLSVAGKATSKLGDIAGVRRAAGLTEFGSSRVVASRANRWLDTRAGNRTAQYFADVNNYEEMSDILPKADFALRQDLVDAKNVDEVKQILRNNLEDTAPTTEVLGRMNVPQETLGLGLRPGLTNIDDIKIGAGSRLYRGMMRRSSRLDKMSAPVPGRELKIDIDETLNPLAAGVQITQTIDNARNYMRLVKADAAGRQRVLTGMAKAFREGDRAALKRLIDEDLTDVVARKMATQKSVFDGASYDFIKEMFKVYRRETGDHPKLGFLNGNESGITAEAIDDLVVASAKGDEVVATLKLDTAHTATEAAKLSTFFPDPRRIRRVTSQFAPIWARMKRNPELYGDPNKLNVGVTFVAEKMFRTMSLLTGGYTTRNMLESSLRTLNIPGVKTGPAHPIEWLRAMSRMTFKGDVDGNEFTQHGAKIARGGLYDWEKSAGVAAREVQLDPAQSKIIGFQNGSYEIAARGTGQDYVEGIATEIRLLAGDEVARLIADGADTDDIVLFLKSAEGQDYLNKLQSRWSGRTLRDADGNEFTGNVIFKRTLQDGTEEFIDGNLRKFAEKMYERVQVKTGGRQSLKEIIANAAEDGRFINLDGAEQYAFANGRYLGGAVDEFERYDYTEAFLKEISRLVATDTEKTLPSYVKYVSKPKTMPTGKARPFSDWADKTTRHFFSYVFGKKEGILNRSPVFRQLYYNKLDELMDAGDLNAEAYAYMYRNIMEAAVKQPEDQLRLMKSIKPDPNTGKYEWNGFQIGQKEWDIRVRRAEKRLVRNKSRDIDDWAARYVGSKSRWEKIKNGASSANEQGLSGDQASWVAKAFAADETQRAFFNAAEANNFVDVLRIAVPFGAAWKESMQYNLKQVALKPNRLRKVENTVRSIRDADPDNDGNGFFYEDPVTGEMMFNVPFGREAAIIASAYAGGILTQTLTGGRGGRFAVGAVLGGTGGAVATSQGSEAMERLGVQWTAPARSFSQVLQILPGFGPAVQIPAASILSDRPEYKDILQVVSPFGGYENITDAVTPAWAKKFSQAITANPERDRWYADLYIDSFRSLVATGDFDWQNKQEMEQAQKQAHQIARSLLVLRALGQFTGPYRPEPEIVVPTSYEGKINLGDVEVMVDNNVRASVLAATFRELQQEDYPTAVQKMLKAFGPEVLMFMPGLTRTEVGGLQATTEFDNWYLDNRDVADQFPDVYAYFAPEGSEFDFQAYLRQLRSGQRERRSSTAELTRDAEAIVGRALYMETIDFYGPVISQGERDYLQQYRADLEKRYPGFGTVPIDLNEQQRLFQELETMALDPRLDRNGTALGLREYFAARQSVIELARLQSGYVNDPLASNANAELRQFLRDTGSRLMVKYPSFGRVYSRLLFDEIDER